MPVDRRTRPESARASFAMPRLRSALEFDSVDQVDFHVHDTVELCFVKLGQTAIEVAGLTLQGKVGTLYVLPPRVRHNQRSPSHWRAQCLLFDHDGRYLDERPRALDLSEDRLLQRWMDDLCRLANQNKRLEDPVADALLFTVVTRILEIENARHARDALHPSLADPKASLAIIVFDIRDVWSDGRGRVGVDAARGAAVLSIRTRAYGRLQLSSTQMRARMASAWRTSDR